MFKLQQNAIPVSPSWLFGDHSQCHIEWRNCKSFHILKTIYNANMKFAMEMEVNSVLLSWDILVTRKGNGLVRHVVYRRHPYGPLSSCKVTPPVKNMQFWLPSLTIPKLCVTQKVSEWWNPGSKGRGRTFIMQQTSPET